MFSSPYLQNDKGQIPADVVPDPVEMPLEMADAAATAKEIKQMLLDAAPLSCDLPKPLLPNGDRATSKAMLTSLGLKLGDRVIIAGQKVRGVTAVSEAMTEVSVCVAWASRLQPHGVARVLSF